MNATIYKDYTIEIDYDELIDNPRDWDNLSTMIFFHKRYDLGDKHDYNADDFTGWNEMRNQLIKDFDPAVISYVHMLDHSALSFSMQSFNGRSPYAHWDSGIVGFILITRETMRKEYKWKKLTSKRQEKLYQYMKGELETYQAYCNGEVYYYTINDPDDDFVDSCGGYYDTDEMLSECKSIIDNIVQRKEGKLWDHIPVLAD